MLAAVRIGGWANLQAMLTQNPEVVRSLLEHQANPNVRSSFGLTPLSIAAVQGLVKHATYLLEAGADVQGALGTSNSVANRRKSVLGATLARQRKPSHSTLSLYRDRSVDEILAGTPLHFAAFRNWPMAELLLRYNADPLDHGKLEASAIDLAQDYGHSDLVLKLTAACSTVDYFFA